MNTPRSAMDAFPNPGSNWWLVLIEGLAAIILGILMMLNPAGAFLVLITFLGAYWLVTGVINLVSLLWNRREWGWKLLTGILGILAGLFIIQNPLTGAIIGTATAGVWLGILGILIGISQLTHAFRGGGWGIGLLGVLSLLIAFLLISQPLVAGLSVMALEGILLVTGGILAIIAAFLLRRMGREYEAGLLRPTRSASPLTGSTDTGRASQLAVPVTGPVEPAASGAAGLAEAGLDATLKDADQAAGAVGETAMTAGKEAETAADEAAGPSSPIAGLDAARSATGEMAQVSDDLAGAAAAGDIGQAAAGMDATGDVVDRLGVGGDTSGIGGEAVETVGGAAAWPADSDMDVSMKVGDSTAGISDQSFTGNVDPFDQLEMAKFKSSLEYIEGVGTVYADRLRSAGIANCLDLLKAGSTAKGRLEIARETGIDASLILRWVNHVDLYRIKGIGAEYADLLEAAGVDTVPELSQRNAANLLGKMSSINMNRPKVRKMPTQGQVENWIAQAKNLPRLITY